MKKITSLFCALMILVSVNATPNFTKQVATQVKIEQQKAPRLEKIANNKVQIRRAPQATTADGLVSGTYYTTGGKFYIYSSSGWTDCTSQITSVEITVEGTTIKLAGLAYFFEDGAITGTISGNTITFPNAQLVGTDEYGDEFLVGSDDAETLSDNIVFTWDPTTKTLTSNTTYIFENGSATEVSPYSYWITPTFSAEQPAKPEAVVLPEGATAVEYKMTYLALDDNQQPTVSSSKYVNVAVVGDQVYFQGLSGYIEDAWVVGTKVGNTVTFAGNQYVGDFSTYGSSYAFYNGETVFTYDAEADTYTATGAVYGVLADRYYDGFYYNPVLSKAGEPDYDNAKNVLITTVDVDKSTYNRYGDVIYTLSNATNDTVFVLDIYPEAGDDLTNGTKYTLNNMETDISWTYAKVNNNSVALKSVEIVKTVNADDYAHIEATIIDNDLTVYYLTYDEPLDTEAPTLATATVKFNDELNAATITVGATDNKSQAANIVVELQDEDGTKVADFTYNGSKFTVTLEELTLGESYTYYIWAKDEKDNATAKEDRQVVTFVTADVDAPTFSGNVTVQAKTATTATLRVAARDNITPAGELTVYAASDEEGNNKLVDMPATKTLSSLAYYEGEITGLTPEKEYTIYVIAIDKAGNKASTSLNFTTDAAPANEAPVIEDVTATATANSVTLTIKVSDDNTAVKDLDVVVNDQNQNEQYPTFNAETSLWEITVEGLEAETSYKFYVFVYDEEDESAYKAVEFTTTKATTTALDDVELDLNQPMFNTLGQRVDENYRGVVIQNGKKFVRQ